MTKIFITGATGFIGGTVLQQIVAAYPSFEITALVRDAQKASKVTTAFPRVTTVIGNLESTELLEAQSEIADVVINTANCDHTSSLSAIIRGIEKRGGGYLIHTSGVGVLFDEPNGSILNEKVWDDIKDLEALSSLPDEKIHRPVEKILLAAPPSVRTALISPGKVHGRGTGPDRIYTVALVPNTILSTGHVFKVGSGVSAMSAVHVKDLARLYLLLLGEALKPNGGAAQWGAEGYYFGVAEDEISIGDHVALVAKALAEVGKIESDKVETWSLETVSQLHPFYPLVYGSSARATASRARALGWKATEKPIAETIVGDIKEEYGSGTLPDLSSMLRLPVK